MELLIFFIIGIYAAFKVLAMYADNLNNKEAKEHQKKYLELDKTAELFAKNPASVGVPTDLNRMLHQLGVGFEMHP